MKDQTPFERCLKDFRKLSAPVNDDPLAQTTVSDLVAAAIKECQHCEFAPIPTRGN